jgi:hypothetical protein
MVPPLKIESLLDYFGFGINLNFLKFYSYYYLPKVCSGVKLTNAHTIFVDVV